jgi:competence protein ComEC
MARSFAFALSSAATAGLVLLTPPLVARLAPWIGKPLGFAVAVPISAQMACGPILVLFSPQVATTSVLANLLAAPAVAPATLLGLAAAVVSPWWMAGGTFLAWLASGATWWIATVASRCAALPGSALPWPSGPGGAAALAGLTAVVITLMLRCSPRDGWSLTTREAVAAWITAPKVYVSFARRRWQMGIASSRDHRIAVVVFATCAAVLVSAGGVGARAVSSARAPNLRWQVAFCDVGQGDAWAVRTGVNSAILVDAGPPEGNIRGCLTDLKITHLDLLVLTHFHADHVGGVGELLRAVSVDRAVVSAVRDPVSQSEATLGLLSGHNVPVGTIPHGKVDSVHRGPAQEGIEGGSAHAEGWSAEWTIVASSLSFPETATTTEAWNGGDSGNANDASLTVHVTSTSPYGTISVTGLGDLEEAGQAALVRTLRSRESRQATGKPLQPTENPPHGPRNTPQSHVVSRASGWRSDIVKVAHHGSAKQSSDLAALLSPIVAVFSVGASNTFGHPTDAALTLYHGTGAHNLRTDECGTLTFLASEGEGMLTNCGPDDAAPP